MSPSIFNLPPKKSSWGLALPENRPNCKKKGKKIQQNTKKAKRFGAFTHEGVVIGGNGAVSLGFAFLNFTVTVLEVDEPELLSSVLSQKKYRTTEKTLKLRHARSDFEIKKISPS
jgi:hypothetical protein